MKFYTIGTLGAVLFAAGCTTIPTNGNDTSFTRTGTIDCPAELQINPDFLGGSERYPLRCGPQTVSIEN